MAASTFRRFTPRTSPSHAPKSPASAPPQPSPLKTPPPRSKPSSPAPVVRTPVSGWLDLRPKLGGQKESHLPATCRISRTVASRGYVWGRATQVAGIRGSQLQPGAASSSMNRLGKKWAISGAANVVKAYTFSHWRSASSPSLRDLSPTFPPPFPLHTSSMPPLPGNVVAPTIECALGRPDDVGRSCFGFGTWPCGHSFYPVRPTTAKNRLFCRKMLKIPHLQR